jgi:hypothetical protein
MMKHLGFWLRCLALLLLPSIAGCGGNSPQNTTSDSTLVAEKPLVAPQKGQKYRKRVLAKGYFFRGEPSKDFVTYEEFVYDENNQEIDYQAHWDGSNTHVITQRDSAGRETGRTRMGNDQTGTLDFKIAWNGDHTEQVIDEFSLNANRIVAHTVKKFDKGGKLLETIEEDLHLADNPILSKQTMVYDGQGFLVESRETIAGKEIPGARYTNDKAGRAVQIVHFDSEGKVSQTEFYEYDANGKKQARFFQDNGGLNPTKQLEARFYYDVQGNLEKEVHYKGACDANGEKNGQCPIVETTTMTYDSEGRMLTSKTVKQQPDLVEMELRFEYEAL